jgi:hypothetical protein
MSDHKRIWLEPEAEVYGPDEGRLWCQDNVWGDDAVEYVLASEAKAEIARLEEHLEKHIQQSEQAEATLLRIAAQCDEHLRGKNEMVVKAYKAMDELDAAKAEIYHLTTERDEWHRRAEKAEAEIARLRYILANQGYRTSDPNFLLKPDTGERKIDPGKSASSTHDPDAKAEIARLTRTLIWIAHTYTEDSHGNMKTLPAADYQKAAKDCLAALKPDTGKL